MTMPKTATVMKIYGGLPSEMTAEEMDVALKALSEDLPGDPIGYINQSVAKSNRCECGAMHLCVDSPDLDDETRTSLHRLLATPFGGIVREHICRQSDVTTVRFGWSGIDAYVPMFIAAVDERNVRSTLAANLSDDALDSIIDALRTDLPGMMDMLDNSLANLSVNAVQAAPGGEGRRAWKSLIDQVMFAFSTPVRKYLEEYASRRFDGARIGAVNCCIIMSGISDHHSWSRRWFQEQVGQQLTPDC